MEETRLIARREREGWDLCACVHLTGCYCFCSRLLSHSDDGGGGGGGHVLGSANSDGGESGGSLEGRTTGASDSSPGERLLAAAPLPQARSLKCEE